jgi:two-component system phosphate regulon sensor histidine kinase PhoR
VPAPSRRIFVYWLLLLVPALAAGVGALYLLRKEQRRLDEQARAVASLRRETIAARTSQIAESVELAIGDVQKGLLTTLNDEVTSENPDAVLETWPRFNPLVQSTFRLSNTDRILRPTSGPERMWIEAWLAAGKPWRETGGTMELQKDSVTESAPRKEAADNVAQNQSVRTRLQETARQSGSSINFAPSSQTLPAPTAAREAGVPTDGGSVARDAITPVQTKALVTPEANGWVSWRGPDGLHMIGWRRPSFGGALGVEVKLDTLIARLRELLPREGDVANSFAITEGAVPARWSGDRERGLFSVSRGAIAGPPPDVITLPLSSALLPGWSVVGLVGEAPEGGRGGRTFFWVGSLLVGTLIVTILAGGTLLLRDARRSEAEAAQKTSFVANVSHEFKTPLTTIRLYSELLEQGRVRDRAQGEDYLRTIGRETQRLARLVNNVLDFSRLEQGRKKFTLESVDLAVDLRRLLETQEPRLVEAGLVLRYDFPATPLMVGTDRDALEQIVLNLLDNACKYAAEGGEVTVSLSAAGSRDSASTGATIRVLDRGPGVPASHRERIFEKFHRVDDTLIAEKSGAGLGLSIARQLARGLGGELSYAPREGGGAEFILSLP